MLGRTQGTLYFKVTSDEFFARRAPRLAPFGVVFVDGLHTHEQAYRDVVNALAHLDDGGAVVVHDCSPNCCRGSTQPRRGGAHARLRRRVEWRCPSRDRPPADQSRPPRGRPRLRPGRGDRPAEVHRSVRSTSRRMTSSDSRTTISLRTVTVCSACERLRTWSVCFRAERAPGWKPASLQSRRASARVDPARRVPARRRRRARSGPAARAARRHVPRQRAHRGQARRLGPPRLELQLARHRRRTCSGGAERRRSSAGSIPTATSTSRRRGTTCPASTPRSTRSA